MRRAVRSKLVSHYGTFFVLLLLCAYYSFATLGPQHPMDARTGRAMAREIAATWPRPRVLVVVRRSDQDRQFAQAVRRQLQARGARWVRVVEGEPKDVRQTLEELGNQDVRLDVIATHHYCASQWSVLSAPALVQLAARYPSLRGLQVVKPPSYRWPTFLSRKNLLLVINQIAVIAIIAIGMTMVIITAGIDLSVGSLIALSGVVAAWAIRDLAGGPDASPLALLLCCLVAVAACAGFGLFSGVMVTLFRVPAFIVTLGIMLMARGLAYKIAGGPSPIAVRAPAFHWLGGGADLVGVPNPVTVMLLLYALAYVLMSHTPLGRYIYAVGGNPEAARLSGVPVRRVLLFVYAACGALAGLGGLIDASLFNVGNPNSGVGYELQIIAAVVVGGTSLAGGEGRILGTLIGALILGVIRNGMYLTKVDSYTQMVIFGLLILGAVLLDQLKTRPWRTAGG